MRIPSGKTDQVIYFVAVDSTDLKTRETGLTSFTVYRSRNGGAATVYTTPTVSELSAANMPGVYSLLIDEDTTIASSSDSEEYVVHITQASMAPVTRTIELYRRDTTSGATLTVTSGRGNADVTHIATAAVSTSTAQLGVNVVNFGGSAGTFASGRPEVNTTHAAGTAWGSGAITAASIAANAITSAKIATDAIGAAQIAADAIGSSELAATAASEISAAVWAETTRILTAGTNIVLAKGTGVTGFNDLSAAQVNAEADTALADVGVTTTVTGRIDAAVSTRLASASYTAPDNASIAAILADTGTDIPASIAALPTAAENATAVLTTAMTEAYSTDGGTVTVAQALYELLAHDQEVSISGTTMTIKKRDGTTTAYTLTLDDATTPTSKTRSA